MAGVDYCWHFAPVAAVSVQGSLDLQIGAHVALLPRAGRMQLCRTHPQLGSLQASEGKGECTGDGFVENPQ